MKQSIKLAVAALVLCGRAAWAGSLAVTVSPNSITNNYVGSITLAISGLSSNGATVRVDRILDVNSNGVVDAYEFADHSYYVTDGQVPMIGGVRNSNVPGDDDSLTNGAILCHEPYPGTDQTVAGIAGQCIYRVTDLGNGQTATAIFGIAQQVLPQGVTGQVFSPGGAPLSNAPVVWFSPQGSGGGGAVSGANGTFTLDTPPGSYSLVTVYPGQLSDAGAQVTVNSNSFTPVSVTNLASDGTTIAGNVADSATSAGLPGISVMATDNAGYATIAFTATNGNYSMAVNSNKWTLNVGGSEGPLLGYCRGPVTKINADASNGSVSNINFQLIKGNALAYGVVTTPQSNGIPNIQMDASDVNNQIFDAQGLTDAGGNYSVVMVAGTNSVGPDSSSLSGYVSPASAGVTVAAGQAIREDFVLRTATASLSGFLRDNLGNPIGNINVLADPTNDTSGSLDQSAQTGADGSFSFGVYGGAWTLQLECNAANSSSLISQFLTLNVANGGSLSNILLTAWHATALIYGTVKDSFGHPVSFEQMGASTYVGTNFFHSGCDNTDTNGNYSIQVFPGTWSVGPENQNSGSTNVTITGTNNAQVNFVLSSGPGGQPSLGQAVLNGGQFQFQLTGNGGQNYRIDASATLLSNSWVPVFTNVGSFQFDEPRTTNYRWRFYRAVQVP